MQQSIRITTLSSVKTTHCQQKMKGERRSGEQIFFLYDHNYLQSEEDDIKDAIKYFHPTSVLEDVQWALCGQLMGIVEFLQRFKASNSPAKVFCLRYNKFAVRSVGAYSMVLGGHFSEPDSVLQEQLNFMHRLFQFYHKSLPDVIEASNAGSQKVFLQGICDSFLALIRYYGDGLSTAFNAVPWLTLQKGSMDVQLHASYLLQCCKKTEGVMSGCLFFKNRLLFSQLPMSLVLPLLIIRTHQNNLPCQTIHSDSELHQGVRLVRIFLNGSQLKLLSSGDLLSKALSASKNDKTVPAESSDVVDDLERTPTKQSEEKGIDNLGLQVDSESISEYRPSKYDAESSCDDLLTTDLSSTEQEGFDSKSAELTVDDLMVGEKKNSVDDKVVGLSSAVKNVKLGDIKEADENANQSKDVLTLSQLSNAEKADKVPSTDKTLNFGSPQSAPTKDENTSQKKKKTILKSKPKNSKALPKTLDIFKAVKLKLKESKPEEKLHSLIWNANHSSSEELFAPAAKPLSLIDLNTESSPTAAKYESTKSKSFSFRSSKKDSPSVSQDEKKLESKSLRNRISSPKSSSMSEASGRSLNIAERMRMSGSSSFSSKHSISKKKPEPEVSVLDRSHNTDVSYLSDSTKSVILQKANKELRAERDQSQKRNVSFQEFHECEPQSSDSASNLPNNDNGQSKEAGAASQNDPKKLHELDLYIQSHSDILLLLFMKKDASQNSHSLLELWRNALPQLGDLDGLVKQCSEITELSKDQNYFFLTFNKSQKQLSGNMLWPITAPQSEFCDSMVNMHDTFRRNPDVHDVTWRTHSYSTYGHQGPLKETFYQRQMPNPPTFSPLVERDSSICLDAKAQKQLIADHNLTFL